MSEHDYREAAEAALEVPEHDPPSGRFRRRVKGVPRYYISATLTTLDVTSRHALITPRCYTTGRSDSYYELERRLIVPTTRS
jgi:hypothetical protein